MQLCRESTSHNGDGINGSTSTIAGGAKDNDDRDSSAVVLRGVDCGPLKHVFNTCPMPYKQADPGQSGLCILETFGPKPLVLLRAMRSAFAGRDVDSLSQNTEMRRLIVARWV